MSAIIYLDISLQLTRGRSNEAPKPVSPQFQLMNDDDIISSLEFWIFPFFFSLSILANGSQCLRARLLFIVRSANETTGECCSECLQESRLRN